MSRVAQFALVGLMLAGVLFILVFPQPHLSGPYQATHGPTVTLRSLRFLLLLMLVMAAAAASSASLTGLAPRLARSTAPASLGSVLLC